MLLVLLVLLVQHGEEGRVKDQLELLQVENSS